MKCERLLLITFFGNYVISTVASALAALVPNNGATGYVAPQSIAYIVLALIISSCFAYWYLIKKTPETRLRAGALFGIMGFVVAIMTTFISGAASVVAQSGSLSKLVEVLPNFGSYLIGATTLIILGFWVLPSIAVGYVLSRAKM